MTMFTRVTICFALIAASAVLFFSAKPVFAQGSLAETINSQSEAFGDERGAGFGQLRNQSDPRAVAARAINVLLGLLGTLFVVYLVYGGALIFLASGSEDAISKGKQVITRAIIGIIIIAASYSITLAISKIAEGASLGEPQSDCVYDDQTGNWYTRASINTNDMVFCPNPPSGL